MRKCLLHPRQTVLAVRPTVKTGCEHETTKSESGTTDGDGDGQPEVYVAARDGKIRSLNAADGSIQWTTTLTSGNVLVMPPPVLDDINDDGAPELVAVTGDGIVRVVAPKTGEVTATYRRKVGINTFPRIADIDGDGVSEILVIYDDGRVVALSYQ